MNRIRRLSLSPALVLIAANFFKALAVLVISKAAAVVLTPHEFGFFGQLLAIVALVNMLSTAGLTNGVVRDVAAQEHEEDRREVALQYLWTMLYFSLGIGALLLLLYPLVGKTLLGNSAFGPSVALLALSVPALAFFSFTVLYYSARGEQKLSGKLQILGTVLGLMGFGAIAWLTRDLKGLAVGYLVFLLMPALVMWLRRPLPLRVLGLRQLAVRRKLGDSAALFSAIIFLPSVLIVAREHLARSAGWDTVAMWQVLTRFSDVYMQMFAIYFGHFFLQKLTTAQDERPLILRAVGTNFLLILAVGVGFSLFYDFAVRLLFTSDYLWGRGLVPWQVAVDALRLLIMVILYVFVARRQFLFYVSVEIVQALTLLALVTQTPWGDTLPGMYAALLTATLVGVLLALALYALSRRKR